MSQMLPWKDSLLTTLPLTAIQSSQQARYHYLQKEASKHQAAQSQVWEIKGKSPSNEELAELRLHHGQCWIVWLLACAQFQRQKKQTCSAWCQGRLCWGSVPGGALAALGWVPWGAPCQLGAGSSSKFRQLCKAVSFCSVSLLGDEPFGLTENSDFFGQSGIPSKSHLGLSF